MYPPYPPGSATGMVAKIIDAGHRHRLTQLTGKLSMDAANGGFFSTLSLRLRVCMLSCHACIFLWYPLTLWLAKLVCMHAVLGPN